MLNQKFLLNGSKNEEQAFIAGWRALAQVLTHSSNDDYSGILAREDKDWIIHLCQCEAARERHERYSVAQSVVQCCNVNREEFRGMLLDCCRINDEGVEVNEHGDIILHESYHNKFYEDERGDQYTEVAYRNASPEDREKLEEVSYINLTNKSGSTVRQVTMYNAPFMEALINKILPNEPMAIINLLHEELMSEEQNPVLSMYIDQIFPIVIARCGCEALRQASVDMGNISNTDANATDDNSEAEAETGTNANESAGPLTRPYEND